MTLIAVTGYKNSGKNAVCNVLAEEYGYTITGIADALKEQMLAIDPIIFISVDHPYRLSDIVSDLGWDEAKEKFPEIRRLLQKGGTEGGRDIFGIDIWARTWYKKYLPMVKHGTNICVSDMRFCNEAALVREMGGKVWRVTRPGTERGEHLSESQLDEIEWDRIIRNTSDLEDLKRRVIREMS